MPITVILIGVLVLAIFALGIYFFFFDKDTSGRAAPRSYDAAAEVTPKAVTITNSTIHVYYIPTEEDLSRLEAPMPLSFSADQDDSSLPNRTDLEQVVDGTFSGRDLHQAILRLVEGGLKIERAGKVLTVDDVEMLLNTFIHRDARKAPPVDRDDERNHSFDPSVAKDEEESPEVEVEVPSEESERQDEPEKLQVSDKPEEEAPNEDMPETPVEEMGPMDKLKHFMDKGWGKN